MSGFSQTGFEWGVVHWHFALMSASANQRLVLQLFNISKSLPCEFWNICIIIEITLAEKLGSLCVFCCVLWHEIRSSLFFFQTLVSHGVNKVHQLCGRRHILGGSFYSTIFYVLKQQVRLQQNSCPLKTTNIWQNSWVIYSQMILFVLAVVMVTIFWSKSNLYWIILCCFDDYDGLFCVLRCLI